jgi:hypothetical protein
MTPPGIDPGTVRLVTHRLNHYTTPGPSFDMDYGELFSGLLHSLLNKTFMFASEFDVCNLSSGTAPYTSHVTFLLFVCLVSIILLNLLNGLAVRDIEEIRKKAEILNLELRLKFISKIETVLDALPRFMTLK